MLTSILTPVVDGGPSRWPWRKLAALYSFGNMLSASAVGLMLAAAAWGARRVGSEPWHWASAGAVLIALAYLPKQLGWTRFPPLMQSTRQVPREWAYIYPRWITSLLFGLGLGSGFYTGIGVPTFYLLLIWPFFASNVMLPVLIWSSYGLARSGNVWWLASTTPVAGDPMARAGEITSVLMRKSKLIRAVSAALLITIAAWVLFRSFV